MDGKDEILRVSFLAQVSVDARVERERLRAGADEDEGADGAEGIERFSQKPLRVLPLEVARGDVVQNRVAVNVIRGVFGRDVRPLLADDDGELALVIDFARHVRMGIDGLFGADDGRRRFCEEDGVDGVFRRLVLFKFADVFLVIFADAENIAAR